MKMMPMPFTRRTLGRFRPERSLPTIPPRIVVLYKSLKYNLLFQVIPTVLMFIVVIGVFAVATKLIVEARPAHHRAVAQPASAEEPS